MSQEVLIDPSILNSIQQGGFVLYFRHAKPTNIVDPDPDLSKEGQEKANLLGLLFKEQNIPVQDPVRTSPLKRAKQTAKKMFEPQVGIKEESALLYMDLLLKQNPNEDELKKKMLLANILGTNPKKGLNTVIVGHRFTFGDAIPDIPYLGMVILKPESGEKGYEVVTLVEF